MARTPPQPRLKQRLTQPQTLGRAMLRKLTPQKPMKQVRVKNPRGREADPEAVVDDPGRAIRTEIAARKMRLRRQRTTLAATLVVLWAVMSRRFCGDPLIARGFGL